MSLTGAEKTCNGPFLPCGPVARTHAADDCCPTSEARVQSPALVVQSPTAIIFVVLAEAWRALRQSRHCSCKPHGRRGGPLACPGPAAWRYRGLSARADRGLRPAGPAPVRRPNPVLR